MLTCDRRYNTFNLNKKDLILKTFKNYNIFKKNLKVVKNNQNFVKKRILFLKYQKLLTFLVKKKNKKNIMFFSVLSYGITPLPKVLQPEDNFHEIQTTSCTKSLYKIDTVCPLVVQRFGLWPTRRGIFFALGAFYSSFCAFYAILVFVESF